jgi:predicted nucleic acid-binding protein
VKLTLNEANSKEARRAVSTYLEKDYALHTVDIALAESLNAVWKHTRIVKDLKSEEAKKTARDLIKICDKLDKLTTLELAEEATNIALTEDITIYDALYIAATQKLNATFFTADQRLHNITGKVASSKLLKL